MILPELVRGHTVAHALLLYIDISGACTHIFPSILLQSPS